MDWTSTTSILLAFFVYYNTLDADFVYDDRRAILTNPDVIGHTSLKTIFKNDFWGTPLTDPGSHGSYRPLCVATYRINYALTGFKPWSYHFLNVLFHCMATALVIATARRLLPRKCSAVGGAVSGLTFAVHPIHTEAVAGVVGRADLAACNLFLLSFLIYMEHLRLRDKTRNNHLQRDKQTIKSSYVRPHRIPAYSEQNFRLSCHGLVQQIVSNLRKLLEAGKFGPLRLLNSKRPVSFNSNADNIRISQECDISDRACDHDSELLQWVTLVGTVLLATAATLCKEPAITVLPVCIFYDFLTSLRDNDKVLKKRWRSVCALGSAGVVLCYWRLWLAGSPPIFATADNPTARDSSFLTRILTFSYLPVFNFLLLICPTHLSFDWSMEAIPRITSTLDGRNILTVLFYTIISKVTWNAIIQEFKKRQDMPYIGKENKYYKVRYCKRNHKTNYYNNCNRTSHRKMLDSIERRNNNMPYKDKVSKKQYCPCSGCKHVLSEEHTNSCRAMNNNNAMTQQSVCICISHETKVKIQKPKEKRHTSRSPHVALLIFLALMILPFIPASNALFYVGFVVAERVLYMPSVGFCLLLGLGAGIFTNGWNLNEKRSKVFMLTLLLVLAAMSSRTLYRNRDWHSEENLFRSALNVNPPKAYGNLGSVLSAQGRTAEAETAFQRALLHRPNMADVHYNLGILLQNQRRYEEAIKSFERAIYFRPSMALAYVNLGASLVADGRTAEAASALRAGARADGTRVRNRREHDSARVSALVQLAALHVQRGHWHKALAAYREALDIIPHTDAINVGWTRHSLLTMAGEIYSHLQQWPQAERSTLAALAVAPNDVSTQVAYAKLLAKNASRTYEAEEWFKKALHHAPSDPSVRDQFGQFLRSQRRVREAAEQIVAAARLAPSDGSRAAAAARALRDAHRCHAAERWYAQAARINPEVAENYSNLGAILHLNGKYAQAAASYRRALQLQPGDEITITNLKRVTALMTNGKRK